MTAAVNICLPSLLNSQNQVIHHRSAIYRGLK